MNYVAIINTPGYLPDSTEPPPEFDTCAEAWEYLAQERRSAEDEMNPPAQYDNPYSETVDELWARYQTASGRPIPEPEVKPGVVTGPTPGYDGDHDLGVAYEVQEIAAEPAITVLIVWPNGTWEDRLILPSLTTFQGLVGGDIELIGGPGWSAFCNEEGKYQQLPVNPTATRLAMRLGWAPLTGDFLVGPVVFCGPPDGNGDATNVPLDVTAMVGGAML